MAIKARYEKGHLIPIGKTDLESGEIVELRIIKRKRTAWKGALKRLNISSVDLQHKTKKVW